MLNSYLHQSRHGVWYLRIHRKGIDKRVSLRTKDRRLAELEAYRFGAKIRQMDVKKILQSQVKSWELDVTDSGFKMKTDGTDEDSKNAKDALIDLKNDGVLPTRERRVSDASMTRERLEAAAAGFSAFLHPIKLQDAITEYNPHLNNSEMAFKSKRMAEQTLENLCSALGRDFDMRDFDNKHVDSLWLKPRLESRAGSTVKKELWYIRAFSEWAASPDRKNCPAPLTLTVPVAKARNKHRAYFNADDLKRIFDALPENPRKAWHRWIPILGLYTGARIGELAALRVDHFFEKAGIKAMHLPGTKTDCSARDIPIHADLIELGLLDLVELRKKAGKERLFDISDSLQNGAGAAPSKWFGAYIRKIGIRDKNKVFHSFRHTIVDHLRQHDAPLEARQQYLGHSNGGGVHNSTYGRNPLGLPALNERVVSKIDWRKYCGWSLI